MAPCLLAANPKLQMTQEKLIVFLKSTTHIVSSSQERSVAQLLKQEILALKNSIFPGFTLILCGRHCLRPNYSKLQVTKVKIFSFYNYTTSIISNSSLWHNFPCKNYFITNIHILRTFLSVNKIQYSSNKYVV